MAGQDENYAAFNSRALVEMVGDVTDEALKATKIKQFLSVLAGRYFNWAGRKSLFTLHLGIKCCAIEMAAAATPRFDGDRFGVLFRSSPRQSDVLLVNGPISKKFADKIVRLWEQMPECPPRPEALIDVFGVLREKIIRICAAPSSGRKGDKPIIVGED